MGSMIDTFNLHVDKVLSKEMNRTNMDTMIDNDPKKISWTAPLKRKLFRGRKYTLDKAGIVTYAVYRPFVKCWLYFSKVFKMCIRDRLYSPL